MVAICVRTLGQRPVECHARPLLFKAHVAFERAAWIECGCLLREAIRLWLVAECKYFDCLPKEKPKYQTPPRKLAVALRQKGEMSRDHYEWVVEAIEVGNKAAHLAYVRPSLLECCITLMHSFLDGSPYLVEPKAGGRV
jgi:hypothetical protein